MNLRGVKSLAKVTKLGDIELEFQLRLTCKWPRFLTTTLSCLTQS